MTMVMSLQPSMHQQSFVRLSSEAWDHSALPAFLWALQSHPTLLPWPVSWPLPPRRFHLPSEWRFSERLLQLIVRGEMGAVNAQNAVVAAYEARQLCWDRKPSGQIWRLSPPHPSRIQYRGRDRTPRLLLLAESWRRRPLAPSTPPPPRPRGRSAFSLGHLLMILACMR